MNAGKLYKAGEDQYLTDINYTLFSASQNSVSGEFIPAGHERIADGGDYFVELEDSNIIRCNLRKNVNRPTVGLPPRFVYRFMGS